MAEIRIKDPVRVRTGRMGALATHARGKTNTAPGTAGFLARFVLQARLEAMEAGEAELSESEAEQRATFLRRLYMTRLALHRHHGGARRRRAAA